MTDRANDWLLQATKDLEHAKDSQKNQSNNWACFAAQQAAEKAIKALHLHYSQEAWGHVIARLLKELPIEIDDELIDKAKVLDNHYIPTRYADSHPVGAPFEHYGKIQSSEAIKYASEIIEFVHNKMAE